MSVAVVTAAQAAFDAALLAGDYATAITHLQRLRIAIVAIPESEMMNHRFRFANVTAIDAAIKDCRKQLHEARDLGGMSFTPLTLTGESPLVDY